MKDIEQIFITLLSQSIRKEYELCILECDWVELLALAKAHDVVSLIYSQIKRMGVKLPESIENKWKHNTITSSIFQLRIVEEVETVLKSLNEYGIDVIIVKGFYFKSLYPNPLYRSMGDADILVHIEDFKKALSIIQNFGYEYDYYSENVIELCKMPYFTIELHTKLIFDHEFKYASSFIMPWENAIVDKGITKHAKILSLEDCFIYMIAHMAKHISYRGHGIRQLCDLILFIEKYQEDLDWTRIIERLKSIELKQFTDVLFSICNMYLNMKLPSIWLFDDGNVAKLGDALCEFIIKCGVFGYREGKSHEVFELKQTKKKLSLESNFLTAFNFLLRRFFPPYQAMKVNYKYLEKYPFLLPYSWLSRTGKYFRNRKRYYVQINDAISSLYEVDGEIKMQKALGLDTFFSIKESNEG